MLPDRCYSEGQQATPYYSFLGVPRERFKSRPRTGLSFDDGRERHLKES